MSRIQVSFEYLHLCSINIHHCNNLISIFRASGESIPVLYYNNIASLHFAMGKPNLACFYLKAALEENKKAIDSMKAIENSNNSQLPPLHTLGKNKHYELMYSLGVSLLYSGQPAKAFDCFTEAAQQFHNSARLWLRMAECCILCHKSVSKPFTCNLSQIFCDIHL